MGGVMWIWFFFGPWERAAFTARCSRPNCRSRRPEIPFQHISQITVSRGERISRCETGAGRWTRGRECTVVEKGEGPRDAQVFETFPPRSHRALRGTRGSRKNDHETPPNTPLVLLPLS